MAWRPRARTDRQLELLRAALERVPDGYIDGLGMPEGALEELQKRMEGPVLIPGMAGYAREHQMPPVRGPYGVDELRDDEGP